MVDLKKARIVQRENSEAKGTDVVILTSQTVKDERNGSLPENIRIALALWDIQKAEEKIENKLQEWSDQAAECTEKALMYKKPNQIQMAKTQLAKRKMILPPDKFPLHSILLVSNSYPQHYPEY